MAFGNQKAEVRTQRGQSAADRCSLQPLVFQVIDEFAQLRGGKSGDFIDADASRVIDQAIEVAAVGVERSGRDAALELQVIAEFFEVKQLLWFLTYGARTLLISDRVRVLPDHIVYKTARTGHPVHVPECIGTDDAPAELVGFDAVKIL